MWTTATPLHCIHNQYEEKFNIHLNSIDPRTQVTFEVEQDGSIFSWTKRLQGRLTVQSLFQFTGSPLTVYTKDRYSKLYLNQANTIPSMNGEKNCELQRVTMITQLHSSTVARPVHTTTTSNWQTVERNATLLCFLTRKASQRG